MEWMSQHLFATISGWDILVWVGAYGVWRYLTADAEVPTCGTDSSTPELTERLAGPTQTRSIIQAVSRWERRDVLLQKQRESLAHRHQQRRKVQRAA